MLRIFPLLRYANTLAAERRWLAYDRGRLRDPTLTVEHR